MPQEHYTGEIWGGYLYDLSRVLKKKAIPYVYNSSYYFNPAGGHRDGYPDFYDAIMAQIDAEREMTGKGWTEESSMQMGPNSVLVYEKGGRSATVTIASTEDIRTIHLTVAKN